MSLSTIRILLMHDQPLDNVQQSIVRYLNACENVTLTHALLDEATYQLQDFDILLAWVEHSAVNSVDAKRLVAYVRNGGALLCLGQTLRLWQEQPQMRELFGSYCERWTPAAELDIHIAEPATTMRRIDPSFMLTTQAAMCTLPSDGEPLLQVSWQYSTIIPAYRRPYGLGNVGIIGLSLDDEAINNHIVPQFIYRTIRSLTGWVEGASLRVALLGYGAIGREHADAIATTAGMECVMICDRNPARLVAAHNEFPTAQTTLDMHDIIADATIDTVIIGTPPNTHAALAKQMVQAGKHVIVEKPFSITTEEADDLIATAAMHHVALSVYQNRRWDPDFLAISEIVQSGMIGEVFHVETFIGGYNHPCDYWHSHEPVSGGVFYDWGSHYLDWMLTLLPGEVQDVRAISHKRVWHDVTNADQAHLTIHFTDGVEASFIHSDVASLLKPKWYILGTQGAIIADWRYTSVNTRKWTGDLIEETLAPSEALPIVRVVTRQRNGMQLESQVTLPPAPNQPFHRNFVNHILVGEPLAVQPRSSRRNIAVMEAAAFSAANGAAVVQLANR